MLTEYLDKAFAPCGQQEIWCTNVFEVLGVAGMEYSALKAVVQLSLSCLEPLKLKGHQIPVWELWVVCDESGEFDQTAQAVERVRLFCQIRYKDLQFEEVLNAHHGKTTLENCVLQFEARSITVQTSAKLLMKNSDLCDAKDAGVTTINNVIHNNKGYGVVLVRSMTVSDVKDASAARIKGNAQPIHSGDGKPVFRHEQLPECTASRES
ncbi:hypothetical protein IHE44_0013625 [Lamprotornis superbus]|uniref:SHC SH2 domain-containing protein n=1 Tax=Lamprotornis superbus TaxID=245042 RepID=A0A835TWF3_9PASS|nr:hypothetical protein IHE44_0013625 [Lamprotornis superbus]